MLGLLLRWGIDCFEGEGAVSPPELPPCLLWPLMLPMLLHAQVFRKDVQGLDIGKVELFIPKAGIRFLITHLPGFRQGQAPVGHLFSS